MRYISCCSVVKRPTHSRLGSCSWIAFTASMNPAAESLSTETPNGTREHGSDSSLQLAQIYSNPRHQEERERIDDILSRFSGRGSPSYQDYTYQDSYDENLETHFSVNEHGAHVGFRMSRSQQTPFGNARSDVGMQMSFGSHGLEVRTSSATSLRRGGQSRSSMLCYSLGSRYTSPLSLFFQPIDSTGTTSPFGGLFSPFHGMYSPALGSYICNQDPSSFESGGPIIEEMIDEDLGLIDEVNSRSHPMIKERENEIDNSLWLGLIPDNETADHECDENIQEEEKSASLRPNGEISQSLTDSEASNLPNIFTNHSVRTDIEETAQTEYSTERQFKESQATASECNINSVEKHFVEDVSADIPGNFKTTQSVGGTKSDIRFKTGGKSKFTKRNFKDVPFKLKEKKDTGLSVLISSPEKKITLEESQSTQPSHGGLVSSLACTNFKEQNKRTSNKNTLPRHRNGTFCNFSSEQDSKFDFESFESLKLLNTMSVSPHKISLPRDEDSMGQKQTESEVNVHGPYSDKITLSSQENNLQSGNMSLAISPTDAVLLNYSNIDQKSKSSQEPCENLGEISKEFHCTPVPEGKSSETSPVENHFNEVNHLSFLEKVGHSFDNLTRQTGRLTNCNNFSSYDIKMNNFSETATKSDWSARVPEPETANTEEDFDNAASTKNPHKFVDGVTFDSFQETGMPLESEFKKDRNEEKCTNGKTENATVSIDQHTFSTHCVPNSDEHLIIQEEICDGKQRKYPRQKSKQHVSSNYESTRNDFSGNINHTVSSEKHHYHYKCAKCLLQENCEHKHLHTHFLKCCQKYVQVCNGCGKQITHDVSTNFQLGKTSITKFLK